MAPGVGGLGNSLLSLLGDKAFGQGHGRQALPSALLKCEGDPQPGAVLVPPPSCLDSGEDCSGKNDFAEIQTFAKAVDESMKKELKALKKARATFMRRACDFRYAEYEMKGDVLENTYGPNGPLLPGGSYLYELRRWADAAYMLHRACNRGFGGCQSLLDYLKDHPEDDVAPGGQHGKVGSKVYTELRKACEVGRTRSPVPNDGPVWCQLDTGLCEQKSCKKWWRQVHHGKAEPWVDDRIEYNDLKEACHWIYNERPTPQELNKYQQQVQEKTLDEKINFCRPKWIEGYCVHKKDKARYGKCTMEDGKWCPHGRIMPGSEMDDTANWKELFPEKKVTVEKGMMPSFAPPSLAALSIQDRRLVVVSKKSNRSRHQSFL